jgi:hypothetical protein
MKHEKEFNQFLKVLVRIIQFNLQDFHVTRRTGADLTVRRILDSIRIRTHETDNRSLDRIWESLLKVLDDVLFSTPVAAVIMW